MRIQKLEMSLPVMALLLSCLLGCSHNRLVNPHDLDGSDGTPTWRQPLSGVPKDPFVPIQESQFEWVSEAAHEEALRLLQKNSWVQLSPAEAARFSSVSFASQAGGGVLVLLRGVETVVYEDDLIGPLEDLLEVDWNARSVRVKHISSRGQPDYRVHRRAVIAFLPSAPVHVYPVTLVAVTGGVNP